MRRLSFLVCVITVSVIIIASSVSAEHTDHTFVGGMSSRMDSNAHLGLANGGFIYTPLYLTIGSDYSCNYSIEFNNTVYQYGFINTSQAGFISFPVHFDKGGLTDLKVRIGEDTYNYRINVLKRSYESYVRSNTTVSDIVEQYIFQDLMTVFGGSLVGSVLGVGIAYWFRIDSIKQEPRRIL